MPPVNVAERTARLETQSEDVQRRLVGIETKIDDLAKAISGLREAIYRTRGRDGAWGSLFDWFKMLTTAAIGAVGGAASAVWLNHLR